MRWVCRRCHRAEVKPWTWPIDGGPPSCSSHPHHQLAVERWECSRLGLVFACGVGQPWHGQQIGFAADPERFELHTGGCHFAVGRAVAAYALVLYLTAVGTRVVAAQEMFRPRPCSRA